MQYCTCLNYIDEMEFAKAEALLTECAQMSQSLEDRYIFGLSVFNLGYMKIKENKLNDAVLYIEQALAIDELKERAIRLPALCLRSDKELL